MRGYTHHNYYERRGYGSEEPREKRKHCHRICTRSDGKRTYAHWGFLRRKNPADRRIGHRSSARTSVSGGLPFHFQSERLASIYHTTHVDLNIGSVLWGPFETESRACRRHTYTGTKVERWICRVVPWCYKDVRGVGSIDECWKRGIE